VSISLTSQSIETIRSGDALLCMIYSADELPDATTFHTPHLLPLQVGHVVRRAGEEVARHSHRVIERVIRRTAEVLVVMNGHCEMDVYDDNQVLVATRELRPGNVLVMIAGGHGFRMLEDTVLLEVKQGPYHGPDEKEPF
jgi:hypothetical protein